MKSKDKARWLKILNEYNIPYTTWTKPEFINSDALAIGGVVAIGIRNADLIFNKNDKLIGTATEYINSFQPTKRKRK